jgi:hypothetical protein
MMNSFCSNRRLEVAPEAQLLPDRSPFSWLRDCVIPHIQSSCDEIVQRLGWVMIGAMLFSIVNTLAGQPASFWHHPETAMRWDGLSIYNPTNRTFDFFLGHGWLAYLIASLAYLATAILMVSILPRMAALVVALSLIFGNYFGASNWLAARWHFGGGSIVYGILLSALLVPAIFPEGNASEPIIKRLRWLMLATMVVDFTVTLTGQSASYWLHPEMARESNPLFHIFLARGWAAYMFFDVFYFAAALLLVSVASRLTASICLFAFTLGHFYSGSTWLFYRWRLGMQAPVLYGMVLSAVIVWLVFRGDKNSEQSEPANGSSSSLL